MPKAPRRPPQLRGRIFRGSAAVRCGLLTRNDLRSTAWRPLFRDVYADASLPVSHRTRCAAAVRWLLPAGAAIAGRSAAALYGVGRVAADEPVDVLMPKAMVVAPKATIPGEPTSRAEPAPSASVAAASTAEPPVVTTARRGPAAGLRVHRAEVDQGDIVHRLGLPITSPARTCWDLARWLDIVEAVVLIDALLARRFTDLATLRDYALARAGRRGWRALLRAVDLADPGAESPQESRTRVRLVLAGLPRPKTQWVVSAQGRFVARLDLAWPEFKVAVEYDGLWHDDPQQFHRDRRRLNQLLGAEWIVLHVTANRLRDDFDGILAEVRAALRSRDWRARPT
ncbi:hypothetical protein Q2K19_00545 [Micromonospora soli]|uniref:endonuclease domain-containing protein n=1 Tax=Micromonospora sp. NBRC 110009 TaxID=3061627 RepID=UPI002671D226|nr:hypothetical protein [Micromonospora sp. NBRC 110009]WKT99040.1 hypothetical protein Q2K19_00545 [Micromonospora sp. NBRC 110009]